MAVDVQPEAAADRRIRAAFEDLGVWPTEPSAQQALTHAITRYVALLAKWNRTYNLTAVRDPEQMLVQHVFDSAAVARRLKALVAAARERRGTPDGRPRIFDIGSGGGLPGIVLALLWPDADFVLVEPVGKKAAFLQQVVLELRLANVSVERSRAEDLPAQAHTPDVVICRAFASLADFARAVDALVAPYTVVAAMKAHLDPAEKLALTNEWRIQAELPLRVPELDAQRALVVLERAGANEADRPSAEGCARRSPP